MTQKPRVFVAVFAAAVLMSCMGASCSAPARGPAGSPRYGGGNWPPPSSGDERATASQPSSTSDSAGESECCYENGGGGTQTAPVPTSRERPGLGTVYGEARRSDVQHVSFVRASGDSPFAVLQAMYNDEGGTRAMIERMLGKGAVPGYLATPAGGGIDVTVVNEYGSALPAYFVGGKLYVIGAAGQRYAIHVANRSPQRYEVVASVDGLDVMDGQRAELSKRGYVIPAYGSLAIEGYRVSLSEVAAFRFGSVAESYAERTGGGQNVGVIGVALFAEQGQSPWSEEELNRRESAEPFSKPPPGYVAH